ncbi:Starch-binding associating with outer membrane [Pedobacter steynii]|uniref:Starch-binding associating with outer membrane n=1 Tax=Pedobacter steynii TaxID=430522 RepID=A0A1G9Y869_9SPHI|nr:RagB/SusD family nutrient uptake outer membrane protein [Pedobacter steynii]NQX39634.1 RagB/SusD family nutrient uptake outer membrane protein [Pedobacter steynii]SDN05217.1 Starch-binding associating with outer membrane [Pedobacter steynii]
MKKLFILPILIAVLSFLGGCKKVLDKENLTAVNPSDVWSDPNIAGAYLNEIYAALMPGNTYGDGADSDEGVAYQRQTSDWFRGTATFDSNDRFGTYDNIRTVNMLLDNIDKASFDQNARSKIKAQALFWRAWSYYGLVKTYGGVPLILTAQLPTTDLSSLAMPRSKTSECLTQIIKDLDEAIALLPDAWTNNDIGRIDKGAAMAFKGRVLLFFASPLFNPNNDQTKWQKAYDANKVAKEFLEGRSKGLYKPYAKMWDDEMNKEVVMVRRFNYPEATYSQAGIIPLDFSGGDVGKDRPSLELVNAFPMKDGKSWSSETRSYDTLFRSRDDRFYTSIYYNGSPNQYLKGMKDGNTYLWTYFLSISNYAGNTGLEGAHNQITPDPLWSNSSFYRVKAVDKTINKGNVGNAGVDWPEIRFAEVLMNYGECANELNKSTEALNVLYQIRDRAGILAGTGNYGITALAQDDIRTAYKNERFVEFCFEGKRWDDLRRWKMFGYLRALQQRHGLAYLLKPGEKDVKPMDDINQIYNKFTITVIPTDKSDIAIKDDYYIYGIPKSRLDRNPKLLQNNNWGGTFNPLD